jgi:hypothetical protein
MRIPAPAVWLLIVATGSSLAADEPLPASADRNSRPSSWTALPPGGFELPETWLESVEHSGDSGSQGAPTPGQVVLPESGPLAPGSGGIAWSPLLLQSLHALTWQHAIRLAAEPVSRQHMREVPIVRNWRENLKALDHWDDQGPVGVNYVAHPLMGAFAGRLLIDNDAGGRLVRPGQKGYWPSRMRALAFSTAYSFQYEVGPFSEAVLGLSPTKEGWVDFVMTPTLGFAWTLAEDALEEGVIRRIERGGNLKWTRISRMLFAPSRTLTNLVALRVPWHRADRGLRDEFERAQRRLPSP